MRAIHHKKHKRTNCAKGTSSFFLCAFCPFVFFVVNCSHHAKLRILLSFNLDQLQIIEREHVEA